VEQVIADIQQHGARKLIFVDLNIIADREYALRLFRALIPLRVQWYGLATVLLVRDQELLEAASSSGCKGLLMGLESISRENLRQSRKGFNTPEQYADVVRALHQHGIALQGCFVFGLDGDDANVFLETAEFAVQAKIDLPRFAIVTPFPNTALYKRLESEGRILTRDWELYDGQHVVFQPRKLSVRELQEGAEIAWRHAYSFRSIARRISASPAPWPVKLGTNLGYRFYANNLSRFYNCDWMIGRTPAAPMARPQMEAAGVA
jgi:radical SAM superfamily enzyme YgiQ (UPF0313 family)